MAPADTSRISAGLRAWWQRRRAVCPECGRKYIRPDPTSKANDRTMPGICWRCEYAKLYPALKHLARHKGGQKGWKRWLSGIGSK